MRLEDLKPDLFDSGIPSVVEGNSMVEKHQMLKPAFEKKGLISQIVFVNENNFVEKVVISGIFEKTYCEEIVFKPQEVNEIRSKDPERGELPPTFPRPSDEEMNEFRKYIAKFNWITAKTFENFSPHQYIRNFPCWKNKEDGLCSGFCDSCKKQREEFEKWVLFIRKYGERQRMLKTVYTVLCCDDKQYWTMGDPMNTTWILNRALIDDPRRKPRLYWLDRQ